MSTNQANDVTQLLKDSHAAGRSDGYLAARQIADAAAEFGVDVGLALKLVQPTYDEGGQPAGIRAAVQRLVATNPEVAGQAAGQGGAPTVEPRNRPRLGTPGLFKSSSGGGQ